MRKFLYQIFVALLAFSSLAFVSCSEEDSSSNSRTIEINGKKYPVSRFVEMTGSWEEDLNSGNFTVAVEREYYGTILVDYYSFDFTNTTCPAVGDDVSRMNLVLTPLTSDSDDPIWDNSYSYVSGHAVVTKTNPDKSELTVKFDNLVMRKDSKTYSFNGTVVMTFYFYGY